MRSLLLLRRRLRLRVLQCTLTLLRFGLWLLRQLIFAARSGHFHVKSAGQAPNTDVGEGGVDVLFDASACVEWQVVMQALVLCLSACRPRSSSAYCLASGPGCFCGGCVEGNTNARWRRIGVLHREREERLEFNLFRTLSCDIVLDHSLPTCALLLANSHTAKSISQVTYVVHVATL